MPDVTVVVSGTHTGVGKTWVAARVVAELREQGLAVAARKPVQSFDPTDAARDADLLAAASGEDPAAVCAAQHNYPLALAPPMAADVLGRPPIALDHVVAGLRLPVQGIAVVEGVGGPRSPLAHDGDTVQLANAVRADVVIVVSEPGLGALNAVLLARDAFAPLDVIAHLNRFREEDPLHEANRAWLRDRCALEITTDVADLSARICTRRRLEVT